MTPRLLLLFGIFLALGCAHLPAGQRGLVGEWRCADRSQICTYVFKRDGAFDGQVTERGRIISQFNGRWSVAGDALQYHYLADKKGKIPAGTHDKDKLLEVKSDHFLIEAADGSLRKYQRIR